MKAGCRLHPGRAGRTVFAPSRSSPGPQRTPRSASALVLAAALVMVITLVMPALRPLTAFAQSNVGTSDLGDEDPFTSNPIYAEQAEREADLSQFVNDSGAVVIPQALRTRRALLAQRADHRAQGNAYEVARLNSVLAAEAFERAASVTTRWLDRRDEPTGLFPHTLKADGRYWSYGDAGSDLFPFLGIGARYLLPERYDEILGTLAAERRLTRGGFPQDVALDTLLPVEREPEKAMLNAVEYAKDGLLPLLEALGPDPWLRRLGEVMDAVIDMSDVPTPAGRIPSAAAEVNGSALQALARLTWATGDPRHLQMGRQIAAAYLEHALPTTEYIPPHRWDFMENEPIGPRRFYLGDHGNEVVAGLVEWHRVERRFGLPEADAHRVVIEKMLDRLLQKGRTPEGLWYSIIDVPSGKVRDRDLSDNWGYLGQAYLEQAASERTAPNGDLAVAARFEQAAATMLRSVTAVDFYEWENGDMDGYADTLESALYLLRYIDDAVAADWVDEQVAVLYGFQRDDGSVTDENIDGNFIRTTMLYGLSLTRGARLEPWSPGVAIGAAADGPCLALHLHTDEVWRGDLVLDTQRHHLFVGLAEDYPRLNQWPEWWAVAPGERYAVILPDGTRIDTLGSELAAGLPLSLAPNTAYRIAVCPS